jgi:hypothetical protein
VISEIWSQSLPLNEDGTAPLDPNPKFAPDFCTEQTIDHSNASRIPSFGCDLAVGAICAAFVSPHGVGRWAMGMVTVGLEQYRLRLTNRAIKLLAKTKG